MSIELVNGFVCHNCTDVEYAKKNIDPQHPKDGPVTPGPAQAADHGPAVVLGGAFAPPAGDNGVAAVNGAEASGPAARLDVKV